MTMPAPEDYPRQLPLELGHEPSHDEADFLTGQGNELALTRILAWPHWPDGVTVLIGPAASGKSHLARIFAAKSKAHFASQSDLATVAASAGNEPLVIEDVDRVSYDEHGLFHVLNQAMRGHRTLLLTARGEPGDWPYVTDDVRSRVRRAAHFRLEHSDDIALSQMFVKLFSDRQIKVDPRIVAFLVARMERSPEEVAILAELMDRLALARGTAITRSIAADALARRSALREHGSQREQDAETDE